MNRSKMKWPQKNPRRAKKNFFRVLCVLSRLCCITFFLLPCHTDAAEEVEAAELDVSGYGLFGNLELKNLLKMLDGETKDREFFDANYIEDAALILISRINRDGYLKPEISALLTLQDGSVEAYEWQETIRDPLPRPTRARRVEFEVDKGVFYFFDEIRFEGLEDISQEDAEAFFVERGALVKLKKTRLFTPTRLERGVSSLTEVLARKGFDQAIATVAKLDQNDETGEVNVTIQVKQGPKFQARSIQREFYYGDVAKPAEVTTINTNIVFSKLWQQDFAQALRATNFHLGYADTTVEITTLKSEATNNRILLDLLAKVNSGNKIKLGEVQFTGREKTKESLLRRKVDLDEGEILDRIEVESGRYRLARLGIFDSVGLRYDQVDEQTRDVIYDLEEGKEVDVSMLFGFGSYELLRIGFDVNQYNIFGRAHRARLRVSQSVRTSSANYRYTMPELVGEDVDVFFDVFGLRREEVSFTREEYGGGAGVRKFLRSISTDLGLRYNYQILNAVQTDLAEQVGVARAVVGSVTLDAKRDKRDNPLYPREGYRVFGSIEVASEVLASEVNYERLDVGASFHQPISRTSWLHFGLRHGVVFTQGSPLDELPFNKRFFPGGESSVRGFQEGEAAPRNAKGDVIGAETYASANIEFEQALTEKWSVVAFVDSIGFAENLDDYPFDETLYSVGLGVRWRTVIGPIRLEYGHNLNPRKDDPVGTVHFSIGFPF